MRSYAEEGKGGSKRGQATQPAFDGTGTGTHISHTPSQALFTAIRKNQKLIFLGLENAGLQCDRPELNA